MAYGYFFLQVDILTLHLQVITCPDSIPTITALIGDVTQGFSRSVDSEIFLHFCICSSLPNRLNWKFSAEKISPKPNPSPTTSSISSSRPDLLCEFRRLG